MSGKLRPLRPHQFLWILLGLTFLWPAAINRGPFYMTDSGSYLHYPAVAIERLAGFRNEWSHSEPDATSDQQAQPQARTQAPPPAAERFTSPYPADAKGPPTRSGRSVYYGALIYLLYLVGGLWLIITGQALLVGALVLMTARHFVPNDVLPEVAARRLDRIVPAAVGVLAFTSLPYFTCFLMPDLVGGICYLAAVMLLAGWRRETWWGRIGWIALLVLGAVSHAGNVAVLLGIVVVWGVAAMLGRMPRWWAPAAVVILAALTGPVSEAAFSAYVKHSTGRPPIPMPFITARLVADGPGTAYLRTHCPQSGFVLCHFRGGVLNDNVAFLWDKDGGFGSAPNAAARLIAAEQTRFVLAVAAAYPAQTALSVVRNAGSQLARSAGLAVFDYTPNMRKHIDTVVPPRTRALLQGTAAYGGTMPIRFAEVLTGLAAVIGGACLAAFAWRGSAAARGYAGLGLAAFAINTLVFGCLSMPDDRYGARMIWILPLLAFLILAGSRGTGRQGEHG